jgi:hypothetical protein
VIERALKPGAPVAVLEKAFVISRGDHVLVELRVPARHARSLRPGLIVRLTDGREGRLVESGGMVDPATQNVAARALFNDAQLLPGQQIAATLLLPAPTDAVTVPTAALAEHAGDTVLYVAGARGFDTVPVHILAQTADGHSVVKGAVKPGASVVVTGAGALSALPTAEH